MTSLLPNIQKSKYEVSDIIWNDLVSEITRINGLVQNNIELQPNDVKKVQALAKQVREYGILYRREISTQAAAYKSLLDQELSNLGYDKIEAYIAAKHTAQQEAINERLTEKLAKFNSIVNDAVAKTQYLKDSSIKQFISNSLISRFPKVNSGALSKEITTWAPIVSVINSIVTEADKVFIEYPVLKQLPATSQSLRAITKLLETGDSKVVANMKDIMRLDIDIIQQLALYPRVATEQMTVNEITNIINTRDIDDATRLSRIQTILTVHAARSHMR